MTGLSVVCMALLVLVQAAQVQGSCYRDQSYFDEVTGEVYCMVGAEKVPVDQWYLTPDCFNCTCSFDYLSCCGIGIKAGVMQPPEGFEIKIIPPCDFTIVPKTE